MGEDKWMFLKDYLLDIKSSDRTNLLFLGIKQGAGKHKVDVLVIFKLRLRNEVHK